MSTDEAGPRCQLFAGHGGAHAVLTCQDVEGHSTRTIHAWRIGAAPEILDASRAPAFSWAPGFPALEPASSPAAADVAAVTALANTQLVPQLMPADAVPGKPSPRTPPARRGSQLTSA
jgi:hypothetical protein